MKKKIIHLLLMLAMMFALMPTLAFATDTTDNTTDDKTTYLGSQTEYQTSLNTFFDANGLRKVVTGWNSNNGTLNKKVGLVNKYGNFVAQPIYDQIQLNMHHLLYGEDGSGSVLPLYFVGGYTQAVRDGKMGLLNTKGEEVIPCKYDFVGLPSEGICQVLNKKDDKNYYLGYWSLEQNQEIVAPNKYVTSKKNQMIGDKNSAKTSGSNYKQKPTGDLLTYHDFNGGYALVFTGKNLNGFPYATVIDKNGKEIYQKSYLINNSLNKYQTYPQQGSYLSFMEPKTFNNYRFQKLDDSKWVLTQTFNTYATGLVGPKGIMIPASYTTGVKATPGEGSFYIGAASFQIILDKGLILTEKDAKPGYLYGGAYGVINFNGKTVLPFTHRVNQELYYHEPEQVFTTLGGGMYSITGKMLHNASYNYSFFVNGYAPVEHIGDFNKQTNVYDRTKYYSNSKGDLLNLSKLLNLNSKQELERDTLSNASTSGYFWVKNGANKWGLIDFRGKTILPFEYDEVNFNSWWEDETSIAQVKQNGKVGMVNTQGKQVLPCKYKNIKKTDSKSPYAIFQEESGKVGLIEVKTGKIMLPANYNKIGATATLDQTNQTLFAMGVCYAEQDGTNLLLNPSGNVVFATEKKFNEASNGLYHFTDNSAFDNQGKIIFPGELWRTANPELGNSYTIYLKDSKVYRVSANYLKSTYEFKTFAPTKAKAIPANTKLMVNGSNVAVETYTIAGNNYIKLRDIANMIKDTEKSFEVAWEKSQNAINLLSNQPYTPIGGEMAKGDGTTKNATNTATKIFVDGGEVVLTSYNIANNNYFNLRDMMQIFDVEIGWNAASSTITLDTTKSYQPTAYQQAKLDAAMAAAVQAGQNPYQQKPTYKEAFVQFRTVPNKILYNVGEPFEIAGFDVAWVDVYGKSTNITNDIQLKVNSTPIYDGYKFQEAGEKTVDCYYNGKKLNNFKISVISQDQNLLADGKYTISVYGNYFRMVEASGLGWMELWNTKPPQTFTVKLIKVDNDRGPMYTIMTEDGRYVRQEATKDGVQLKTSTVPHMWRINQYGTFCTIRDYGNQKFLVNASGQQSKNGTKVIIWTHTGKAPDNAKLVFTKVN